jgi:hypothetical protein
MLQKFKFYDLLFRRFFRKGIKRMGLFTLHGGGYPPKSLSQFTSSFLPTRIMPFLRELRITAKRKSPFGIFLAVVT